VEEAVAPPIHCPNRGVDQESCDQLESAESPNLIGGNLFGWLKKVCVLKGTC